MSAFDEAVSSLYQAPFNDFVSERKRLAGELKAAGKKEDAARVAKLARPVISVWAVNQLWWKERPAFEALFAAAQQVKVGDRDASRLHRDALGRLREHAARLLREAGNAATESTLRRVTTTLSALAAIGGFAPDPPGALTVDRDPPGFEALAFGGAADPAPRAHPKHAPPKPAEDGAARAREAAAKREAEAEKREAEAEKRRAEAAERQRRHAERERLSTALRDTKALRDAQQSDLKRLREEVEAAEQSLKKTQALLTDIEHKLAALSG